MRCPNCASYQTKCKDSRQAGDIRRRRYICNDCGTRFDTGEEICLSPAQIKADIKRKRDRVFRDITYCVANDCAFLFCDRHPKRWEGKTGVATFADFSSVCKEYIEQVIIETEGKK